MNRSSARIMYMRRLIPVAVIMILFSAGTVAAVSDGGVNKSVDDLTGTGIDSVDSPSIFVQDEDFIISVNLNESSDAVKIYVTTQICVNSGLCYPPEMIEMVTEDNVTWTSTVSPMIDQTYVTGIL